MLYVIDEIKPVIELIFKLYIEFKKNDKSKMKLYGALFIGSIFVLFLIYYLAPTSM